MFYTIEISIKCKIRPFVEFSILDVHDYRACICQMLNVIFLEGHTFLLHHSSIMSVRY